MKLAQGEDVKSYPFVPGIESSYASLQLPLPELPVEDLIPLLYGALHEENTDQTEDQSANQVADETAPQAGMLGAAGIRVPGSAGETTNLLEKKYGIPPLAMADGPAGLRLQQSYEVNPKTDRVYGAGVLRMLENGFLEPEEHHEGAQTYYQ